MGMKTPYFMALGKSATNKWLTTKDKRVGPGLMRQKYCILCNEPVLGGPTTKYCLDCKAEVKREQQTKYKPGKKRTLLRNRPGGDAQAETGR